jgi:tryptophan 2-monooxygenase
MMSQTFVDNPEADYLQLFEKLGGIDKPLGKIEREINVGIVGLGTAGSFGGWMLSNANATVTAYERGKEVGGRFMSLVLFRNVIFEMGGMRFPPCETIMYLLAAFLGFGFLQDFPDPGKVPTLIWRKLKGETWNDPNEPPAMCKKIFDAFRYLEDNGVKKNGRTVLVPLNQLKEWSQSPNRATRMNVQPAWQKWLTTFKGQLLLEGIQRIMGPDHEWDWPEHLTLSPEDQKIWGDLGFGSGGFRDLFECDFCYIIKLLPNGLEYKQATFAKRNANGSLSPAPVQDLIRAIWQKAAGLGMKSLFEVDVTDVELSFDGKKPQFKLHVLHPDGTFTYPVHDVLILTPTIKVALMQKIANRRGDGQLFSDPVLDAFLCTDLIPSSKMFALIDNFLGKVDKDFPRDILSDKLPGQGYTLDYGREQYLADLQHYAWKGGSTAVENYTAEELEAIVMALYKEVSESGGDLSDLAERHRPRGGQEGLVKFDWQKDPRFNGAFVLAGRDQQKHIAAMDYDFLKMRKADAIPIFYMSDCASQTSGWFDAVRGMVNVCSAIIGTYGALYAKEEQPFLVMTENLYTY